MSTVKISQLPVFNTINANTANTLFVGVDIPTDTTFQMTATTLAQGLYSNNPLVVGVNPILFTNTVAQFSGYDPTFLQVNMQNFNANGSGDVVITGDKGTNSNNYVDLGYNGSKFQINSTVGTAFLPNDGYLYVHGSSDASYDGNLVIGATSAGANVYFIVGSANTQNIIMTLTKSGLVLNTQSSLTFSDGTVQRSAVSNTYVQASFSAANGATSIAQAAYNLANTEATWIQSAWNTANSAASNTVTLQSTTANNTSNISLLFAIDAWQNTIDQIQTANIAAAFTKANNALANTTGTFAGDLTLTGNLIAQGIQSTSGPITTGNLIVNGTGSFSGTLNVSGIVSMNAQVVLTNTSFSNTQSALTITATPNVALPSNDGYMIHISGKQNVASRIVSDSYGANTYVVYAGRTARGNVTNPSAVQTGDILSRFSGNGYGTTGWAPTGSARIDFVADENFTDTSRGTQIQFFNTKNGTNTLYQIATFNADSVTFTGAVNPQKGFIYTPSVYAGAQTAITIDFANNSVVRAQTASGITVTVSNLVTGKEVVAWITNTAGSTQAFTHGLSAINSTTGSTSYNMPGGSTIMARYMSIDGTTQNTFVSIVHA